MPISFNAANGLLNGASDPDNGINGCSTTLSVVNISATTPVGGSAVLDNADGSFTFSPPPGVTGPVTFTYQVQDDGCPGIATSAAATVTVTVSGPTIWFVDDSVAGGNGTLGAPFQTLAQADAVDAASHRVFVYSGSYPTGLTLNTSEWLVGQAATGTTFDLLMGITPPAGTLARPSINGAAPVLQSTVTAANSAVINGIAVSTAVNGFVATSVTGFTVVNTAISSSGGTAVSVTSATPSGTAAFSSVSSSGTAAGISLTSAAGAWTFGTGALNGAGTSVHVSGGTAAIAYDGTISQSTASVRPVNIVNAGGSATFNGGITASGTANGINLDNNDAATVTFRGGLSLTTGASVGFNAVNGATAIAVCATTLCGGGSAVVNTITTTTGTALNVAGTTIGASGLRFQSISANGGANGIVLNTTGSSGGLTVTGTGSAASGGTIQNGAIGISLTSTRDVSIDRMQLNGFSDFAIRGTSVVNFTMSNTTIGGINGNDVGADEGSVRFTELTGSASITNSNISGAVEHNVQVINTSGTLNRITVSGTTFGAMNTATGSDGLLLETQNTAVINATVENNFFTFAIGDHFQYSNNSAAQTGDVVFTGNTITNTGVTAVSGGGGIRFVGGSNIGGLNGSMTFNVSDNNIRDARGTTLAVNKLGGSGTFSGTIADNIVGATGASGSGSAEGSGIFVLADGTGTYTAAITGNTVRQYDNFGIFMQTGGSGVVGSAAMNITVTGNTVAEPEPVGPGSLATNGFHLNGGVSVGDTYQICVSLSGNTLAGSGQDSNPAGSGTEQDFRLRQRQSTTVRLPGYAGGATDTAAVVAFLQGQNPGAETGLARYELAPWRRFRWRCRLCATAARRGWRGAGNRDGDTAEGR